jgi:hypothetical protein
MAVTFASFHTEGNVLVSINLLNKEVNIGASTSAASFNIRELILSNPLALFGFKLRN